MITKVDWESSETHLLVNPRLPEFESKIRGFFPFSQKLRGHIWLLTSGSTGDSKWVALSKEAFLTSGSAVNSHLDSTKEDIWLNLLPQFHVGGLAIFARAWLTGAAVINCDRKWDPQSAYKAMVETRATLSAIVPAQLFDLVNQKLRSPRGLRALIIGGGSLNQHLYDEARELGWPILQSYGLTECASQAATSRLNAPDLIPLEHVEIKISPSGHICLKSKALLTTYAFQNGTEVQFKDPKQDGWFETEDRGMLAEDCLVVLGRNTDFIKIGGESVSVLRLETIFENLKWKYQVMQDMALIAVPNQRLGHQIELAVAGSLTLKTQKLIGEYNQNVMPFERIRCSHCLEQLPRSPLNKLLRAELLQKVMDVNGRKWTLMDKNGLT
jgi:O-succinylbenzoic acid--CoA ligase